MIVTKQIKGFIRKWTKALTSGEFAQTKDTLNDHNGYCCLGVACTLFIPKDKLIFDAELLSGGLPTDQDNAPDWLQNIDDDFYSRTGKTLSALNDNGVPFKEIAEKLNQVYLGEKVAPKRNGED